MIFHGVHGHFEPWPRPFFPPSAADLNKEKVGYNHDDEFEIWINMVIMVIFMIIMIISMVILGYTILWILIFETDRTSMIIMISGLLELYMDI